MTSLFVMFYAMLNNDLLFCSEVTVLLRFRHVDLCDVRQLPGLGDISNQTATMWRFAVIADESVDRFVMRDLDSMLTKVIRNVQYDAEAEAF